MKYLNQLFLTLVAMVVALTGFGQISVTPEGDATTLANALIGSESSITIVSASLPVHPLLPEPLLAAILELARAYCSHQAAPHSPQDRTQVPAQARPMLPREIHN